MGGMVSMKDIAARAGCSVNAVSRALRNDPKISAARKAQVQALAAELGYRKDPLVAALMGTRSRHGGRPRYQATIALMDPLAEAGRGTGQRGGALLARLEAAIRTGLEARGYKVEEFPFAKWRDKGPRFVEMLKSRGIAGIAFLHFQQTHFQLDWDLSELALVAYGYTLDSPGLHRVSENHAQAVALALANTVRLGYRRPGLVLGRFQHEVSRGIRTGQVLAWYLERDTPDPVPPYIDWNYGARADAGLLAWYDRHRPDVILGHNSSIARQLARHFKLRYPDDLAFVNLNHGASGDHDAGIDINPEGCGRAMADILAAQLSRNERGIPAEPRITLVRTRWVDGTSCPAR